MNAHNIAKSILSLYNYVYVLPAVNHTCSYRTLLTTPMVVSTQNTGPGAEEREANTGRGKRTVACRKQIIHNHHYRGWGGDVLLSGGPKSYLKKDRYATDTKRDVNENRNNKMNEHIAVCG